jgi:hypothetical protein
MKKKKYLKIAAGLTLGYALFGFFIFPTALRHFGEKALREHVSPEATISKVKANPFTWQVQVEGLSLADAAGQWSLKVERATLNLSAKTLYKFYPVLDLVRLETPEIRYLRSPLEERVEVSVEAKTGAPESLEEVAELVNTYEIPEVLVVLLEVTNGAMDFRDVTNANAFSMSVNPINFRLENFTTAVDVGDDNAMRFLAVTETGTELEWTGTLTSQPFASNGMVRVSGFEINEFAPYFEKFIKFDLKRATYAMQFSYAIDFGDLENLFTVSDGSVDLLNVLCVARDESGEFFVLDSAGIAGIHFDYNSLQLDLGQVFVQGGLLGARRNEAGLINLLDLLVLPETATIATPEPVATSDGSFELPELPIGFKLDEFLIQDFRIQWEDTMIPGSADLELLVSEYRLKGLSSDFSSPVGLDVLILVGENGRLTASGDLIAESAGVDLTLGVDSLDLSLANAYSMEFADTQIKSGAFSYTGGLTGDFESGYDLTGNGSVPGLSLKLAGVNTADLDWELFSFSDLSAKTKPLSLRMGEVVLTGPKAVLTRSAQPEGSEPAVEDVAAVEDSTETQADEVAMANPVDLYIASFVLNEGSMLLVDDAIQPGVRLSIEDAQVSVGKITLGKEQIADFSINALVNRSQFTMKGTTYPIDPRIQTSIALSLRELSLPVFSPYSGQAVGRKVGSGWFTLNTDVAVNAGELEASNQILIDQMELGESVDSPGAIKLPLSLAISLLKGPDGVMDLQLPLKGDLYDPSVGLGQIIRTAVFGLIRGAASAPFSMLSKLVGSDADLSKVEFAAASSELSPKILEQLDALGSALQKRPQLTLSMTPSVSDDDLTTLARLQVETIAVRETDPEIATVIEVAPEPQVKPVAIPVSDPVIERVEASYEIGLLNKLWKRIFSRSEKSEPEMPTELAETPEVPVPVVMPEPLKEPPVRPEPEQPEVVADVPVLVQIEPTSPEAAELMSARTRAIMDHLLQMEGITEERVSELSPALSVNRSIVGFDLE